MGVCLLQYLGEHICRATKIASLSYSKIGTAAALTCRHHGGGAAAGENTKTAFRAVLGIHCAGRTWRRPRLRFDGLLVVPVANTPAVCRPCLRLLRRPLAGPQRTSSAAAASSAPASGFASSCGSAGSSGSSASLRSRRRSRRTASASAGSAPISPSSPAASPAPAGSGSGSAMEMCARASSAASCAAERERRSRCRNSRVAGRASWRHARSDVVREDFKREPRGEDTPDRCTASHRPRQARGRQRFGYGKYCRWRKPR